MFKKLSNWIKSIISESKAITWPSKKRIYKDTLIVVISLVVGGSMLALIDFGLLELFKFAISKVG